MQPDPAPAREVRADTFRVLLPNNRNFIALLAALNPVTRRTHPLSRIADRMMANVAAGKNTQLKPVTAHVVAFALYGRASGNMPGVHAPMHSSVEEWRENETRLVIATTSTVTMANAAWEAQMNATPGRRLVAR